MSNKSSEKSEMSDAALASALVKTVVSVDAGATIGERIRTTARKLGWDFSRTRDVWYEQARRIDATEMDQLRAARWSHQLEEARKAHAELTAIIVDMEAAASRLSTGGCGEMAISFRSRRGASQEATRGMDRSRAAGEHQ